MPFKLCFLAILFGSMLPCPAQEAIPVGKGSYAASPPKGAGDGLGKIQTQPPTN